MIPLPKVRDKDLAAAKSRGRIGVAALTVDATTKMEKLETSIQREAYNVGSHWTNWERRTRTHQAHYYLGQDFEPVARSVLSGLFEIDPSSTRKAHVMARVWIDSKRDRNIWCRYWDTKATVSFSVLIQERDKSQTIQHYEGQDTGTDCATLFLFPSGERVGEIVQGAFDTMMKRIGEAR